MEKMEIKSFYLIPYFYSQIYLAKEPKKQFSVFYNHYFE